MLDIGNYSILLNYLKNPNESAMKRMMSYPDIASGFWESFSPQTSLCSVTDRYLGGKNFGIQVSNLYSGVVIFTLPLLLNFALLPSSVPRVAISHDFRQ